MCLDSVVEVTFKEISCLFSLTDVIIALPDVECRMEHVEEKKHFRANAAM